MNINTRNQLYDTRL